MTKKKRRSAGEWYKDYESWIWRTGIIGVFAMVNLWLTSKFISVETYWKIYRENECRFNKLENDVEVLKERTHR